MNYAWGQNKRGLEVWADCAPITIDAEISIYITASNYFLAYCLVYISFIMQVTPLADFFQTFEKLISKGALIRPGGWKIFRKK